MKTFSLSGLFSIGLKSVRFSHRLQKCPSPQRDQLGEGELPESLTVLFDDPSIASRLKGCDDCVSITPVTATYQGNRGYGDIERRILSVILSWAVTVYKPQGTTLNAAVIEVGPKMFAKGQRYVALNDGIAILDLCTNNLLNHPQFKEECASPFANHLSGSRANNALVEQGARF